MANDEEHAKMLAEAQSRNPRPAGEDSGPPLVGFTREVEALQLVVNELRLFRTQFINSKQPKGAKQHQPQFLPWPKTALARATAAAERARKMAKHQALVARVLPHKRRTEDDVG